MQTDIQCQGSLAICGDGFVVDGSAGCGGLLAFTIQLEMLV